MSAEKSRTFTRREVLRAGLVAAGVSLLAACKPQVVEKEVIKEETSIVEKEVTAVPPQPTASGPVKVTFWGWWDPRMALYDQAAQKFTADNPNITIEVQSLPTDQLWSKVLPATAAGTGPTLLKEKPTYYFQFLSNDLLAAYPEDIFPDGWWKENYPDTYKTYQYEGQNYVFVVGGMANLLMYNKKMFEAAGLDPDVAPKTWDDLVTAGKALTQVDGAGNILVEGLILGEFPWLNAAYQLGGSLVNVQSDGTRTSAMLSDEAVQAFHWIIDLFETDKISSRQFITDYLEAMGTEKAAMGLMTSWINGDFVTSYPDVSEVLGWAAPPTPSGNPDPVYGYQTNTIGVSVFAPRPDAEKTAGFQYLEFLLKNDDDDLAAIAELLAAVPGKLSVRADPRFTSAEATRVAIEVLPQEKDSVQESDHLNEVRDNAIDRVVMEGMTVEESLSQADEEWNGFLSEGDAAFMQ